ncbi:MAG: efflux RND transporter permease subunit [Cyanobacteria bacterium J06623_5]
MSFNASSWSIRRPVPTLVLFLVLILMGITSFLQLGIDANPNIDLPIITIKTTYPGAGPQELETQFTQKVEDAVAGLGDVTEIYSGISDGNAYTNVRFDLSADTDKSMDAVQAAIDRIRQDLAPYAETMTIQQMRYDDGAVLTYAIRSETQSIGELSDFVDRTIQPALMAVKGVEEVRRVGGVDREIRVDLDPFQLEAYGISTAQVNQQIIAFNENLPGGRSQVAGEEQNVRALGRLPGISAGLAALKSLGIALPADRSVPLETLATVSDSFSEVRQVATVNNQPVVSFSIFRSNGSLLVEVEDGVKAAIASLQPTLPPNTDLQLIFTRATDIREAYKASIEALLLGSILAVVVVGCFLRNWRTTLITAAALPLSIIPTFIIIKALGYSLNSMTLLALTLAVGNLVDDAIVEIENVERHIAMGKTPTRAALDSSAEVGLAVVTTTATVVAVFIPVAFMGGIPGQFFQPFGVTVAVSTMFSTLVARFITPLLASRLLLPAPKPNAPTTRPTVNESGPAAQPNQKQKAYKQTAYERLLRTALRHRLVTMIIAIAIFLGSLTLIPHIPTGLSSASNTDLSHLSVELPPGTSFQRTQQITHQLTEQLKTHPAVASIYVNQNVADAEYVIQLKPKNERDFSRQAFEQQIREGLLSYPDLRFTFDSQGLGNSEKALNIILKGADPNVLDQAAADLSQQMRTLSGIVEVSTSNGLTKPELLIIPNAQQATDLGVSLREIATTATLATLGDTDTKLATLDAGDRQIPIRTRLAPEFRSDLGTLANLSVMGRQQQLFPLSAVADISLGGGPADIRRFDRTRQVTIAANLQNISLGQALESVYSLPTLQNLPEGITEQTAGDADILQDVFQRFSFALGTAIIMIYAVLVLLYNSFIYPLAVMSSLPLGIGGTFIALMLTQKPLDLYSLIGIVLLMGLVTKNAILLVDCALQARGRGLSLKQAVIESGITRMRPILMTSISTVSGMVPIALELGAGGEVRSPMAIAVIGGFSTATLLTLIVVPVCFTYIASLQQHLAALPSRLSKAFTQRVPPSARFFQIPEQPVPAYAAAGSAPSDIEPYPNNTQRNPQTSFPMTQVKATVKTPASASIFSRSSGEPVDSTDRPHPPLQPLEKTELTYKIACIENDFDTLCRIHSYLHNTAFSIVSVADPAIALTDLTTHRPDIILMTTSMPGLNSFQICDRLRKTPTFRHVPIILLSNQATWWHSLKAKWYGATACLPKPLDRTTLLIKLFFLTI